MDEVKGTIIGIGSASGAEYAGVTSEKGCIDVLIFTSDKKVLHAVYLKTLPEIARALALLDYARQNMKTVTFNTVTNKNYPTLPDSFRFNDFTFDDLRFKQW